MRKEDVEKWAPRIKEELARSARWEEEKRRKEEADRHQRNVKFAVVLLSILVLIGIFGPTGYRLYARVQATLKAKQVEAKEAAFIDSLTGPEKYSEAVIDKLCVAQFCPHEAFGKLIDATEHPNASIRVAAVRAIASRHGHCDHEILWVRDLVKSFSRDASPDVRIEACKLMAPAMLETALGDTDARVRLEACRELGSNGPPGFTWSTLDKLRAVATSDPNADVRAEAERVHALNGGRR